MRTGQITASRAVSALEVDPVVAVEREEEVARLELLVQEVDRELAVEARTEVVRLDRSFTDARRARRAARRGERAALRVLPVCWDVADLDGEAA